MTTGPPEGSPRSFAARHTRVNREHFDRTAQVYDRGVVFAKENRNNLKKIQRIQELLGLTVGERVLEVGTGTGVHARELLGRQHLEYHGLDLSPGMLAVARRRLADRAAWRLAAADGTRLPYADGSFDGVYISGTLHHFAQPAAGVREMARVLRPGRRLVVMEANILFVKNVVDGLLQPSERTILGMRLGRLCRWARDAGLEVVEATPFLYTPPVPAGLHRLYDRLDELLARVPLLRRLSIMIYLVARKPRGGGDGTSAGFVAVQ